MLERSEKPIPDTASLLPNGRDLNREDARDLRRLLAEWRIEPERETTTYALEPIMGLPSLAHFFRRVERQARCLIPSDLLPPDSTPVAVENREARGFSEEPASKLVNLGPVRPSPTRVHLDDDASDDLAVPLIRKLHRSPELRKNVNTWMQRLGIPYRVDIDRLISERSGTTRGHSFHLTDTRSGVEVGLGDVGYGVSQVLPIVTECVGASRTILCIEQPELHLHPRLAADLSELLVEAAIRGNQIIAETHSENILLRVQRLVSEGKIPSTSVAVLYVDNQTEAGATVKRLRLDEDGDLLDRWPGGFFDDRLADVLGIDGGR